MISGPGNYRTDGVVRRERFGSRKEMGMERNQNRMRGTRSSASGAVTSSDDDVVLNEAPIAADVNMPLQESAPVDAPDPREVGGGLAPGVQRRSGLGSDAGLGITGQEREPIGLVREGMKVYDAAGDEIGKVDFVKMGDPDAVTVSAATIPERNDLVDTIADVFRGPDDLPQSIRERLLRNGFIHVDGKGWIDKDRYVAADAIAAVTGDVVRLSVTKDDLLEA
jgi:hypothetical protein